MVNCSQFVDFLTTQTPFYDQEILKDIRPTDGWIGKPKPCLDHLLEDYRFLPKRLVSVYVLSTEKPNLREWHIARRLKLQRKTVESRLNLAWDIIHDALKAWLKTLPENERRRERYKRLKTWRSQKKFWPTTEESFDRFRGIWPNVTSENSLRSDWPPPSKLNCVGTPCDPWEPMHHWD